MARWKNVNGVLQKIAGSVRIDQVLNGLSRNAISNKAVSEKFEEVDLSLGIAADDIDALSDRVSTLVPKLKSTFTQFGGNTSMIDARGTIVVKVYPDTKTFDAHINMRIMALGGTRSGYNIFTKQPMKTLIGQALGKTCSVVSWDKNSTTVRFGGGNGPMAEYNYGGYSGLSADCLGTTDYFAIGRYHQNDYSSYGSWGYEASTQTTNDANTVYCPGRQIGIDIYGGSYTVQ